MTAVKQALGITDVVLRDAHQSILATRVRLEDMLPIAPKLDQVGFWSVESWGARPSMRASVTWAKTHGSASAS